MIKTKLLLSVSLLLVSFSLYAAEKTVKIALINSSSAPIPNPIHITGAYISYSFMPQDWSIPLPNECPTGENPKNVTPNNLPITIALGTESKSTINIPDEMSACFKNAIAIVSFIITEIDNIKHESTGCGSYSYVTATSKNSDNNININILRTIDNFYCHAVH